MKITREKPSQRRHHRVNASLMIDINGKTYKARDWGLGGFSLDDWQDTSLQAGDAFSCTFCLPFQGFEISFDVQAEVVRLSDDQVLAAKFPALDDRHKEIMSYFIEDLVRGTMTTVDDTIMRIDSPVTPVSTKPDPSPLAEVPKRRWPLQQVAMTTLYMSVGMALLVYIVFTIYANFFSLEVDSGVVAAPIEKIISTTDGKISKVTIQINELVVEGDKLISIEDARVEREIELAKVEIERIRSELEQKQKELAIERDKLDDYRYVTLNKIDGLTTNIKSLNKRRQYAQNNTDRLSKLIINNVITKRELDTAESALVEIEGELDVAKLESKKYRTLLKKIDAGRYFTGERFEGMSRELEAEVSNLKEEVALTTRELVILYEHRERLTITAPSNGRLLAMLKTNGSSTKRGETIALFERDENRVIEVYLTQEEVMYIKMGNKARVYFPSRDIVINTQVKTIDRTEGYIDEVQSRYNWRGRKDRTAKVTLQILDYNDEEIRQQFTPGLPAVVIFPGIPTGIIGDFMHSLRSHTAKVKVAKSTAPETNDIFL